MQQQAMDLRAAAPKKRRGAATEGADAEGRAGASLVGGLPYGLALQRKGPGKKSDDIERTAASGVGGVAGSLPYGDRIAASFGRHDVTDVPAHVGGKAAEACDAIGAEAYATAGHTAFKSAPDLHTAAHEAAHVVQQRAGVQLKGGVGQAGDRYEQHADRVADLVVQGRSAEGLLSTMSGAGSSSSTAAGSVQCKDGASDKNTGDTTPKADDKKPSGPLDKAGFQRQMKSQLELLWEKFMGKVDTELKKKAPAIKGYANSLKLGLIDHATAQKAVQGELTSAFTAAERPDHRDGEGPSRLRPVDAHRPPHRALSESGRVPQPHQLGCKAQDLCMLLVGDGVTGALEQGSARLRCAGGGTSSRHSRPQRG